MTLMETQPQLLLEPGDGHFVFENVPWSFYLQTLEYLEGAGQHARVTFDQGRMEIMTTTGWHENLKTSVARLLELYSFIKQVPIHGMGGLTCKREDMEKGLEPDECYFIGSKFVTDESGHLDLVNGPPPQLAVEVVITRTEIPKHPIFAALGIPELWRVTADSISVMSLVEGQYVPTSKSQYLPDLDLEEFRKYLQLTIQDQYEGAKAFGAWLTGA